MNTKLIVKLPFIFVLFFMIFTIKSYSCTTFCLKNGNQIVYGRNLDFDYGQGFITTNRRNLFKVAFISPSQNPISWISKYGSITFNSMGKEFPDGGMNEKGLVVAMMNLKDTKYPPADKRKAIHCLQWIQYQLDVSSTVNDVIASDTVLRISDRMPVGTHFLVCDKQGNVAAIEFINGKLVCHTGDNLPLPLLQNQTYDISYNFLKNFKGFGGKRIIPWKKTSDIHWSDDSIQICQNREYVVAANRMKNYDHSESLVENAFDVLGAVTEGKHTQWSTVFDVTNMKIYFKNHKHNEIMTIDFKDFSFDSSSKSKILDIQSCSANNTLKQFVDYSTALNRKYVFNSFNYMISTNSLIHIKIPKEYIERQATYPETIRIVSKQKNKI